MDRACDDETAHVEHARSLEESNSPQARIRQRRWMASRFAHQLDAGNRTARASMSDARHSLAGHRHSADPILSIVSKAKREPVA
jgi:hypothetical protein